MVMRWSEKMKILELLDGIKNKEQELVKICEKNNLVPQEVAYIGDDVNDLKILEQVGLSGTPNDGIDLVKEICDYVCQNDGGYGAFREFADLILRLKNKN